MSDYVLCRKCVNAKKVTKEQTSKYSWKYFCDGRLCGWFRGNDFWAIAKPCEHYEPLDKQIKWEDLNELH